MDQPFSVFHEYYRMYFERAMAMKEEQEKREQEEAERKRQQAKAERNAARNKTAAHGNMKQTPPSPSIPSFTEDDLEELIEEVI